MRLLKEAGYPDGFALKLWRTQRAELARLAQSIQQNLTEVGIRAEIVERDASSAREAVRHGEADLFLTDWWADYPDPENFNYPLFHSRNKGPGGNYAFLTDPTLDSLITRARATTDSAENVRLARAIDGRVFRSMSGRCSPMYEAGSFPWSSPGNAGWRQSERGESLPASAPALPDSHSARRTDRHLSAAVRGAGRSGAGHGW
jgi:hypothetical protein